MLVRTRSFAAYAVSSLILGLCAQAFAQFRPTLNVNCNRGESLANAVAFAFPNTLINIKGTCTGPVSINTNGLQLNAIGVASINGAGKDAVTINGVGHVTLSGLVVTGGANGIVAQNGAQVYLQNDTVSANKLSGIVALANSSVTVTGGSSQGNTVHGLDIEATSALLVTGSYSVTGNGVFGINVNNGSSLTLTGANLNVKENTLGIQRAGSGNSDRGLSGGSFCRQPKMAETRRADEQTSAPEPHSDLQGEGGISSNQGRKDAVGVGRAV